MIRSCPSDEARRSFRDILDEVQGDREAAVMILRYGKPVAVIVSAEWYDAARKDLEAIA